MRFRLVTNPYGVSRSPIDLWSADDTPSLVVEGAWSRAHERFAEKHRVAGLYLNHARGWSGDSYRFLDGLPWLTLLDVLVPEKADLTSVSQLPLLERLRISSGGGPAVDFTSLSALKRCALTWWTGARSVFDCDSLDSLSIEGLPARECGGFCKLHNLRDLTIYSQSMSSLESIAHLTSLEKLELNRFRKLESLDGLEKLTNLRSLNINECSRLSDLTPLAKLTQLEHLVISDWGTVDSLAPIADLKNLRAFSFSGARTTVADGDLSPLEALPKLSMLMFGSRRHYSHRLIKPWSWDNFFQPDRLLERK